MLSSRRRPLLSPTERAEMALQDPSNPDAMRERGRRLMASKLMAPAFDGVTGTLSVADELLDAAFWRGVGEEDL